MGLEDREWYREEWRKKHTPKTSKPIGQSKSGDYVLPSDPNPFRRFCNTQFIAPFFFFIGVLLLLYLFFSHYQKASTSKKGSVMEPQKPSIEQPKKEQAKPRIIQI